MFRLARHPICICVVVVNDSAIAPLFKSGNRTASFRLFVAVGLKRTRCSTFHACSCATLRSAILRLASELKVRVCNGAIQNFVVLYVPACFVVQRACTEHEKSLLHLLSTDAWL